MKLSSELLEVLFIEVIPGIHAGASLKRPVVDQTGAWLTQVIPGIHAGASLKLCETVDSQSGADCGLSPAFMPGPH